jgi:hypothetical protein
LLTFRGGREQFAACTSLLGSKIQWLNSDKIHHTGVILKDSVLKDLARTTSTAVRVHVRSAPDPFDFGQGRLFASSG